MILDTESESNAPKEPKTENQKPKNLVGLLALGAQSTNMWGGVVILFATLLIYWPSLGGMFIWDDGVTLTENPLVLAPNGLHDIWFSTKPHDYWPLTYSSLWL